MKKNLRIISGIISSMLVVIGAAGCSGDILNEMFDDNNSADSSEGGNYRGGDEEEDQSTSITLQSASAYYYGAYYSEDTENIIIRLIEGQIGSDGYFTGKATALDIDLIQSKGSGLTLIPGTYSCSTEAKANTFMHGFLSGSGDDAYDDGSTLYIQNSDTDYQTYYVSEGTVTIKKLSSGDFNISAKVKAGDKEYTLSYEGTVEIEDWSGESDIEDDDEGSFPGSSSYDQKAKAYYNGDLYNQGNDDYTLIIYCGEYGSDGNFVSKGYEVAFDILTTKGDGNTISSGTYICTSNDFTAFHFLDGIQEDNIVYPSYFYKQYSTKTGDYSLELITDGRGTITRTDGKYQAEFYFKTSSSSYLVNYSGDIEFIDNRKAQTKSVSTSSSRRHSGIPCKISYGSDNARKAGQSITGRRGSKLE